MLRRLRATRCTIAAFTLLELAVTLLLASIIVAFAATALTSNTNLECYPETQTQLQEVKQAVTNYVRANNRYPLPASRNYGLSHPLYGREVADGTDTHIDRVATPSPVLIGTLPIVTLGLGNRYGADCWGNQLTYAVTESLTTTAGYTAPGAIGSITMRSGPLASPTTLSTTAAYIVVSHGADVLVATPRHYEGIKKNCNQAAINSGITRIDKENCDTANTVFYSTEFNNGRDAPNFFDDLMIYAEK